MMNEFRKKAILNKLKNDDVLNFLFREDDNNSYTNEIICGVFFKCSGLISFRTFYINSSHILSYDNNSNSHVFIKMLQAHISEWRKKYTDNISIEKFNNDYLSLLNIITPNLNCLADFGFIQGRGPYEDRDNRDFLYKSIVNLFKKDNCIESVFGKICLAEGFDCFDEVRVLSYKD